MCVCVCVLGPKKFRPFACPRYPQIRNSDAKMVIAHPLFHETAAKAAEIAGVDKMIVFGGDALADNTVAFEDIRAYESGVPLAIAACLFSPPMAGAP